MGYVDYVGGNDVDSKKYKKIVPVFLTVSNEYFKYFGVLLQSIINHANTACFFDVIVIIDEEISDDNFGKLEIILSGIDNFRVRFLILMS
jgi:lipopolysaccharide biosynthesis glycosyltransferase